MSDGPLPPRLAGDISIRRRIRGCQVGRPPWADVTLSDNDGWSFSTNERVRQRFHDLPPRDSLSRPGGHRPPSGARSSQATVSQMCCARDSGSRSAQERAPRRYPASRREGRFLAPHRNAPGDQDSLGARESLDNEGDSAPTSATPGSLIPCSRHSDGLSEARVTLLVVASRELSRCPFSPLLRAALRPTGCPQAGGCNLAMLPRSRRRRSAEPVETLDEIDHPLPPFAVVSSSRALSGFMLDFSRDSGAAAWGGAMPLQRR